MGCFGAYAARDKKMNRPVAWDEWLRRRRRKPVFWQRRPAFLLRFLLARHARRPFLRFLAAALGAALAGAATCTVSMRGSIRAFLSRDGGNHASGILESGGDSADRRNFSRPRRTGQPATYSIRYERAFSAGQNFTIKITDVLHDVQKTELPDGQIAPSDTRRTITLEGDLHVDAVDEKGRVSEASVIIRSFTGETNSSGRVIVLPEHEVRPSPELLAPAPNCASASARGRRSWIPKAIRNFPMMPRPPCARCFPRPPMKNRATTPSTASPTGGKSAKPGRSTSRPRPRQGCPPRPETRPHRWHRHIQIHPHPRRKILR